MSSGHELLTVLLGGPALVFETRRGLSPKNLKLFDEAFLALTEALTLTARQRDALTRMSTLVGRREFGSDLEQEHKNQLSKMLDSLGKTPPIDF